MNPMAYNIGASRLIEPLYIVATQLKSLIAVGTPTNIVMTENKSPANSDCPLTNIWCPQTRKLTAAIPKEEYAIAV